MMSILWRYARSRSELGRVKRCSQPQQRDVQNRKETTSRRRIIIRGIEGIRDDRANCKNLQPVAFLREQAAAATNSPEVSD